MNSYHTEFITSLKKKMSWAYYLQPIEQVSNGSAIISKKGQHCCHKGSYNASMAEEVNFSNMVKDPLSYAGKSLMYKGKKYYIIRSNYDMVFALNGNDGIMIQNSKTVLFVSQFNKCSQRPECISCKIYEVVRYFCENNC